MPTKKKEQEISVVPIEIPQTKAETKPTKRTVPQVVLEAINLRKEFDVGGRKIPVINGVNCKFVEGEFVSIMGPSGSGKSTLLYLLSGIETLTSGQINILGKDLSKMKASELAKMRAHDISFVFQSYNLINHFTVYENVITPLLIGKQKVDEERVDQILMSVGMYDFKNTTVNVLSGGEQQRVAIARALVTNPKIIFADEATGNLDSKSMVEVMNIFRRIANQQKITIIQVTHSERCAQFSDRVINLLDGRVRNVASIKKFL